MSHLSGVYVAVLTPMHSDYSCNHKMLASHCFDLLKRGCSGIALFGTTGEGPSFSLNERIEALEKLVSEGFDPSKIILANGSSGISETIELGLVASKHGCAAYLISPPSFYKDLSTDGVLAFYRAVITPNLPVLLYHIPKYSGVPISLEVIEALIKEYPDTVIGIKDSDGHFPFTKTILETFPQFKVFVGNERQIVESVALGGAGTICGIANLYPELICSLLTQDNPEALNAIFQAINGLPFIPAAKAMMKKREGEAWHTLRPPLLPLLEIPHEPTVSLL